MSDHNPPQSSNAAAAVASEVFPHIVVVGAGAMGCYFGGMLIDAGQRVSLIDVNPAQIDTINQRGLILETDAGRRELAATAALAQDVTESADLVILFTKTLHTEAAMASISHLLTPSSVILSLQNGLGNAERIQKFHDASRIAVGTTLVPADLQAAGHVVSHGPSSSRMMDVNTQCPTWMENLATVFNAAGLHTELDRDIHSVIWSKVAFNAALNAVCAVTGATPGPIGQVEEALALVRNMVHETVLAGSAQGVTLDEEHIWHNVEMALREQPNHKPSMLQDIEHGRTTEIDAINGAIVDAAQRAGIEAPVNQTLLQLVKLKQFLATQSA
ncbi:ketopantoate reductase family protein [Marinobacterium lutimaris]|uniref:2-dehydropantoate 2-reductase n=1 Tax=Marinobacterium lutimaris TaxID=568106 RepID=A0A1H6D8Q0_9GAMM|nr:2-dehydropantoate 2-reductase [Marinobacterium lutimaris]SEG81681.1 ketopantoate reductase [Marinobacterium lutimaris]